MKHTQFSGAGKFIAGMIVGAVLFSGSAIALNNYVSDNSPENGYLLCANNKTKAVTFPNKLSCPSGTTALDLGAVTGVETPVSALRDHPLAQGAEVAWHDPLVEVWEGSNPVDLGWDCDVAILATMQPSMNLSQLISRAIQILDCTNSISGQAGVSSL
jgi:hypothetical protein